MVHLISMHNLDVLTQARLSPGPMGDLLLFFLKKESAKDFGICLLVLHTVFSMQGKVGFGLY